MDTSVDSKDVPESLGAGRAIILWFLFFLISFGLGYPKLNRFDSRKLGPDEKGYYNIVVNQEAPDDAPFCFRVLVPELAKPFYLLVKGRVGSWNAVAFGLLISNSLFCATSTFLLLLVGLRVLGDLPVALLGCTLYLLNFVVPNMWLAGMVDSSEACLMMAVTWALFTGRWWLLPLIGIPGGFAKQSFLPFSTLFATTWWIASKQSVRTYRQIFGVAAMGATCMASLVLTYRVVGGSIQTPWAIAALSDSRDNYALNILKAFMDQEFWYAFVWLLPLGVWRLNRFPKPWVMASAVTALLALGLGGYADLLGTVCRPLFGVIGPVLTLSTATLIAGGSKVSPKDSLLRRESGS